MKKVFTILMMVLCLVAFSTGDAQAKKKRTTTSSYVGGGYYEGNVGGSSCSMTISGSRGNYAMSYDSAIRILKRVSNGVYKAYKGGKFIGTFRGTFSQYGDVYSGRFYNPKGASSPFYLYLCGADD